MDNQTIDVTSVGNAGIEAALSIIWACATPSGKATHYKIVNLARNPDKYYLRRPVTEADLRRSNVKWGDDQLIAWHSEGGLVESGEGVATLLLLWHEENGASQLPFPLDMKQTAVFIKDWLSWANYGSQPDHDGDNEKGWRLFTEDWGHVVGHHYAIVGAQPAWAMYGK